MPAAVREPDRRITLQRPCGALTLKAKAAATAGTLMQSRTPDRLITVILSLAALECHNAFAQRTSDRMRPTSTHASKLLGVGVAGEVHRCGDAESHPAHDACRSARSRSRNAKRKRGTLRKLAARIWCSGNYIVQVLTARIRGGLDPA